MDTDEGDRGREVSALLQRSAALWGQILTARAPKGLGGLARRVDQAHRRLARLNVGSPQTASAQRFRRRCLEEVQSQRAELEVLLAGLVASTAELTALADRQRESEVASPILKAQAWTDGPRLPEVSAMVLVLSGVANSEWPWLFLSAALLMSVVFGGSVHPRLEFQFDGRSLRVVQRLLGLRYVSTTVDLTSVVEVVVTGVEDEFTALAVRTPDGVVVLGTHPTGRDSERLAAQLREWWQCAAREHC